MIKITNIQATRLIGALLILLSGNAFAVTYATQPALNTEISNRKSGDSTETARAKVAEGALKAADTAEKAARITGDSTEKTRATKVEETLNKAIAAEKARAKAAEPVVHIVGESYQGGIIFWVDPEGQHGLIAAKADQSSGIQWYNGTYFAANATADGIYAGAKNTEVIISTQTNVGLASTAPYAALVAANYSIQDDGTSLCTGAATETCYGDWYLPSKFELNLLYAQKSVVGGFANYYYWSSTESNSGDAWYQGFTHGLQSSNDVYYTNFRVRAVRAF